MKSNQAPLRLLAALATVIPAAIQADDEVAQKRNAAEQAAALNQDPGGADTPGASVASVDSVSVPGTSGSPSCQWENGTLTLAHPEPDRTTPHDVSAVTFRTKPDSANTKANRASSISSERSRWVRRNSGTAENVAGKPYIHIKT